MNDKEKEIAATNRLINIIRGDKDNDSPEETASTIHEAPHLDSKEGDEKEPIAAKEEGSSSTSAKVFAPKDNQTQIYSKKGQKGFWKRFLNRPEKKAIGIDIGSTSIKYILLQKGIGTPRVLDYRIEELPHTQGEESNSAAIQLLHGMIHDLDLSNITIVSSVSGPSVIVRHVQFPPMNEKELAQSLRWEAKSYIPFPLNEINLDYQVLPKRGSDQSQDVILVAVTKKLLRAHLDLLESIPIEPNIVDIDPLVLINTYMITHEDKGQKTVALLNIGAQASTLSIYREGSLFFTRDIHIAGNTFTKLIQSTCKVTFDQAEAIKKGKTTEDIQLAQGRDLEKILKPVLDELITEIRRSLIYYDNQTGKSGFSQVVLTGGGALLNNLPQILETELGLDVEFLDPFSKLHVDETGFSSLLIKEQSERLALSVGLAMRGLA